MEEQIMNMEFTQEHLLVAALNAVGYLAAAGLSLLLYSVFSRKKTAQPEVMVASIAQMNLEQGVAPIGGLSSAVAQTAGPTTERAISDSDQSDHEYMKLDAAGVAAKETAYAATGLAGSAEASGYGRNRAAVIRLARKMLESGESAESVTDLLPITESEMRLVSLSSASGGTV